jgi:hypothetical protein
MILYPKNILFFYTCPAEVIDQRDTGATKDRGTRVTPFQAGVDSRMPGIFVPFSEGISIRSLLVQIGKMSSTPNETLAMAQAAFEAFHARCFWHMRKDVRLELRHIPIVAEGLRKYGGREGFLLSERLCP